jgi:putative DNA primase/helicase
MTLDPCIMAHALGGDAHGHHIVAPGPGHSRADRSLSIKIDQAAPDGFYCHSFSGDDWRACRDHVRRAIGRGAWQPQRTRRAVVRADGGRIALALRMWGGARDPRGTLAAAYLASRGLTWTDDIAGDVIRYQAGAHGGIMIALLRDVTTNEPCGVHRTFLDSAGRKLDRKMLGRARGAAIKLDADENVTLGLHIGEGVETCLAARLAGFRPVWAVGSASSIAALPVLGGIETITVLGEVNDGGANRRAAQACAERWIAAGRESYVVTPLSGDDLNDAWREVAP